MLVCLVLPQPELIYPTSHFTNLYFFLVIAECRKGYKYGDVGGGRGCLMLMPSLIESGYITTHLASCSVGLYVLISGILSVLCSMKIIS
jgi:hypothetical protein